MSNVFYLPISLRRAAKLSGFYIEVVSITLPIIMWCYIAPHLLWFDWRLFALSILTVLFILKRYLTKRFNIYRHLPENNQLFIQQFSVGWQYESVNGVMRISSMRINRVFALLAIKEKKRDYVIVILSSDNTKMDYHKLLLYRRYHFPLG